MAARSAEGGEANDNLQPTSGDTQQNVTTSELRSMAGHWSLAGDRSLLQLLENIHQNIVDKAQLTNSRMEEMTTVLDNASVALQNVNNRFMALSNTQFVESRVFDDDVAETTQQNAPQVPRDANKPKSAETELAMVNAGLRVLEQFYDEVRIVDDSESETDSGDEDIESVVLRPKNLYTDRPLPYIIGSTSWKAKWHAGLLEEDSDSDSSVSKREKQDEQYSSSEESASWMPGRKEDGRQDMVLPIPRRDEDAYSGDTAMSEDSVSNHTDIIPAAVPPAKPTPSDFAAELARRLGGEIPPARTAERKEKPEDNVKRQTYTVPAPRLTGNIFLDEPPPLDNTVEEDTSQADDLYSDTDDIFADLRNTNVFNKPANPSYGGLFDDLAPEKSTHNQEKNRNETGDIFDDFADNNSNLFIKKHGQRNVETVKKIDLMVKNTDEMDKKTDDLAKKTDDIVKKNDSQAIKKTDTAKSSLFDDYEDDLFADVGISNVVPKMSINKPVLKGGLFDDEEEIDIFSDAPKPASNVRVEPPSTNIQKDLPKATEDITGVKKPVGAVSLFGSNQGTESIGAAILKHRLRKPSTSSEDEDNSFDDKTPTNKNYISEEKNTKNDNSNDIFADSKNKNDNRQNIKVLPHISSANDVFDDLFAQATSKNEVTVIKNKEKVVPEKPVEETVKHMKGKVAGNDNFDDLFAQSSTFAKPVKANQVVPKHNPEEPKVQSIFNDDDDDDIFEDSNIFTSTKIITDSTRDMKDLFKDDDDLFSNVQKDSVKKTSCLSQTFNFNSPSLFDEDDELFTTTILEKPNKNETSEEHLDKSSVSQENYLVREDTNRHNENPMQFSDSSKFIEQQETVTSTKDIDNYREYEENNIPVNTASKKIIVKPNDSTKDEHIFDEVQTADTVRNNNEPISTKPMQKESLNINKNVTVEKSLIENVSHTNKVTSVVSNIDTNIQNIPEITKPVETTQSEVSKQELIPKPKIPGDDFFDTILDDQPPVFEKPKEPKKSKNINALFEDDSDDEGLFLKKPNNLSTTIKEVDDFMTPPSDRLYGLFLDEPPDLDISFGIDDVIEDSPRAMSSDVLGNVSIRSCLGGKIQDVTLKQEDILDEISKENEDDFQDLEYIKTVRLNLDLEKAPSVPIEEPIKVTQEVSTFEDKNTDGAKETFTSKTDTTDGTSQSAEKVKTIGKLRPMNLNINVHGLLPGASPKKTNKNVENTEDMSNVSNIETVSNVSRTDKTSVENSSSNVETTESTENIVFKKDPIDSTVRPVSFDKGPESPTLLNTYSKERAKIQVKRRPSTRKARKDAIRKSAVVLDSERDLTFDSTDNYTSSVPASPQGGNLEGNLKYIENKFEKASDIPKPLRAQNKEFNSNKELNMPKDKYEKDESSISTLGKVYPGIFKNPDFKDISASENKIKSNIENIFHDPQEFTKESKESVKNIIFGEVVTQIKQEKIDNEIIEIDRNEVFEKDPIVEKSKPKHPNDKSSKQTNKVFSSDDDEFDELFKPSVLKVESETKKDEKTVFADASKSDDAKSKSHKSVSNIKKSSLFEDDNLSDDDLFGAVKKTGMQKLRETKIDKVHPKDGLYSDSDNEDLFSNKKKDTARKPTERKAVIPNRGTEKKISLFGDDESDDDIFGTKNKFKASKPQTFKSKDEQNQAAPASAEQVFEDPLSIFDD